VRIFLLESAAAGISPGPGQIVALPADESRHLLTVVRARPGDPLLLTDGAGRFFRGKLSATRRGRASVEIVDGWDDPEATRPPRLVLACAVVKGRRFEWVLEKSVELGSHEIRPLRTERTVIVPGDGRQRRWRTILATDLKQAGRSCLPELHPTADLATCLREVTGGKLFHGEAPAEPSPAETEPPVGLPAARVLAASLSTGESASAPDPSVPPQVVWLVGPEGGWSAAERQMLAEAGSTGVSLAPHRLRVETAAVAGLVFLQTWRQTLQEPDQATP